ncbi:MAG: Fe-S cluster assembly sulfur transfer protein SufU [Pseudomonadota bacterium]
MTLNDLYQARILELNRAPLNHCKLTDATHSARGVDALCGDDLLIQLHVNDGGVIECACWSGEACAITSASASMLTAWLPGRNQAEVERGFAAFQDCLKAHPAADDSSGLGEMQMLRAVRNFPSRVNNALLPWRTTRKALKSTLS